MPNLSAVALGGALGALLRYGMYLLMARWAAGSFPLGTWLVNILGCFAIGILAAWFDLDQNLPIRLRIFLVTGVLGGFTTFSAFGLETVELLRAGAKVQALTYVSASLVGGLCAVVGGHYVTTLLRSAE